MPLSEQDAGGAAADQTRARASSEGHLGMDLRHNGDEVRYVDPSVLEDLEEQLASRDITARFARDYAEMWGRRQHCLEAALERRDRAVALEAVMSLKVSSAMVGGVRLARLAEKLELVIRGEGDLQSTRAILVLIADHGNATVKELQDNYMREDHIHGSRPR
jgi:HPt (histidine-containing phosphotransfer) domain-containing protein